MPRAGLALKPEAVQSLGANAACNMQIVSNGRRNVTYRDGRPLAIAVTEGLRESGVPLVRTFQYANHCTRSRPSHLGMPEQVSSCFQITVSRSTGARPPTAALDDAKCHCGCFWLMRV